MPKPDVVTIELRLRPGSSLPSIPGAKLVQVFPGDRDPELRRMYLAYVPRDEVAEVLQNLEGHPLVETAKVLERRKINQ